MSVGVMKDYKLKQRNLRVSHTLGMEHLNEMTLVFFSFREQVLSILRTIIVSIRLAFSALSA